MAEAITDQTGASRCALLDAGLLSRIQSIRKTACGARN